MLVNPTRGYHWSDAETRALLTIWGEHDVQTALDGNFRNSHVYRDVAGRLGDMGYDRTPDQCRVRVKSLKRQYFQAKKASKKNGHYAKIFRFYKDMERILSTRSSAGLDAHDLDGVGAEGDETLDGTEEDGESLDQPHESDVDGAGECSNMEYPVKIEYPPYPIPVTVSSCSSKSSSLHFPACNTIERVTTMACSFTFSILRCYRCTGYSGKAGRRADHRRAILCRKQAAQKAVFEPVAGETYGEVPGTEFGVRGELL